MSAYSDKVIADGAIAYWRLGEPSGVTAVDAKGGLNGTYSGAPLLGQPGALGGSGDTDTSVDFTGGKSVTIPASSVHQNLPSYSVDAWIYPTATMAANDDIEILGHNFTGPPMSIAFGYGTATSPVVAGKLWGGFFASSTWHRISSPADLALNVWSHVAVTWNASIVRLYVNGVEVANGAQTGWFAADPAAVLYIGRKWDTANSLPGRLDEVALYPTALSAATIASHYSLGITPQGPGLRIYKSGDGSIAPEKFNAVVGAVYAKNSSLSTLVLKAGGESIKGENYNALINAVYALSPSLALLQLKTGDGSIDGKKFNSLVDIVNALP